MHKEIKESGLGELFKISHVTDNPKLIPFMGKKVRYKRNLLNHAFVIKYGTIAIDGIFAIKEVQKDCCGNDCLRGYFEGDDFGRCMNPKNRFIVI